MRNGGPSSVGERPLRLRGAHEADRKGEDDGGRRRPFAEQFQQSEEGGRRVADGDHRAVEEREPTVHRDGGAGGRGAAGLRRESGLAEEAAHAVPGRKALADHSVRDHPGVGDHRLSAGERGPGGEDGLATPVEVGDHVGHAAGVHDANRDLVQELREAREVRLGAHDLERAAVDLVRVAEVVGRSHRDPGS